MLLDVLLLFFFFNHCKELGLLFPSAFSPHAMLS